MNTKIFTTDNNWNGTVTRTAMGAIMLPHGAQKLFGLFGGYGFSGTMDFFTETVGLPWIIGLTVIIVEFFGLLALLFGFATRIWAALFIPLMLGILATAHLQHGFFMNWFGNQQGEGYEFDLLMMGLAVATLITGGGKWSVDRWIAVKSK